MIGKEWAEQSLKLAWGLGIGLLTLVIGIFVPQRLGDLTDPGLRATVVEATGDLPTYLWGLMFNPGNSAGLVLLILAATVGSSLIAAEVSRDTIYVLLSRPLSRECVLLTKYGVGAAGLLGVILALLTMTAVTGQVQRPGGALVSALLLWLGSLFVLGLSTLFSVMFRSSAPPLLLSLGVTGLLALLPALLRLPAEWSLPAAWSSVPAFLGQQAPVRELLVSLVAASLPMLLALRLFRRRPY